MTNTKPFGMDLHRTAWDKVNRLQTGVERFHLSKHKWGLAPLRFASAAPLNKFQTTSQQRAPQAVLGMTWSTWSDYS